MTAAEAVERTIRRIRPHAKFLHVQHSSEFIDPGAMLGAGFFKVNLYDEEMDANMMRTRHGRVILENTYVASFAYNLLLCWLQQHRAPGGPRMLDALLAHNFKKFFAEQLYHRRNCILSRSFLLETLLFEESQMQPVYAAKNSDPELAAEADEAVTGMVMLSTMHEMGHFYLEALPGAWYELMAESPPFVGELAASVLGSESGRMAEEFRCDTIGVLSVFRTWEPRVGAERALRIIVFTYAASCTMYALRATAAHFLQENAGEDAVDFSDVSPDPHEERRFECKVDEELLTRTARVVILCRGLAEDREISLFGEGGAFPLPEDIVDDLLAYVARCFDCVDQNARRMSHLVARALHEHDRGMEFLYLRSKTYTTKREGPLRL